MSRLCKESISSETVGKILQDITDLLATATSETEYNIIRVWKETLQQYRFRKQFFAQGKMFKSYPALKICPFGNQH